MEFQNGIPIYIQVIRSLQEQIMTGAIKPGDKLPSSRELAMTYQINPNTAARVLKEMDSMGITTTKRGIGTFITDDADKLDTMRKEYAARLIEEFTDKMQRIGCSPEQLPSLLEDFIRERGNCDET